MATGGTIFDIGPNRYHLYLASGVFDTPGPVNAYVFVLGGGGQGGQGPNGGGGGGAGGWQEVNVTIPAGSNAVTVGAGGQASSIGAVITSLAGGRGGPGDGQPGQPGGSGGGGSSSDALGGAGTPGQGFDGGQATPGGGDPAGGGGGGASEAGTRPSGGDATRGGHGKVSNLLKLLIDNGFGAGIPAGGLVGGGGGGGGQGGGGGGGNGGGGAGAGRYGGGGAPGAANTGGGGGGARDTSGGALGGSGIVVISYPLVSPVSPPSIAGDPVEGSLLTATPGVWTGGVPESSRWQYSPDNNPQTWVDGPPGLTVRVPYETTGFLARFAETGSGQTQVSNVLGPITVGPPPKWVPLNKVTVVPVGPKWVPLESAPAPPVSPHWVPLSGPYPTLAVVAAPSVTGRAVPGDPLTRVPGVWVRPSAVTWEWMVGGVSRQVGGDTFVVPNEIGAVITLVETATGAGRTLTSTSTPLTIIPGNIGVRQLSYPREKGNSAGGPHIIFLTVVDTDDWGSGPAVDNAIIIPKAGFYTVEAGVNWPSTSSPGVGWGNGWSGEGSSTAWIVKNGDQSQKLIFDGAWEQRADNNYWNVCGPGTILFAAGDRVEFWGDAGATGIDPFQWEAYLKITDLS